MFSIIVIIFICFFLYILRDIIVLFYIFLFYNIFYKLLYNYEKIIATFFISFFEISDYFYNFDT